MNHTLCHFEIPADDVEKIKSFYEKLFGWKFQKAEGMDYFMIDTGAEPGGGLMKKPVPQAKPCNYINVESVIEYSKKFEELGGKIVMPKSPVPTMGWFAVGIDPEGNCVGLFEEDKNAR